MKIFSAEQINNAFSNINSYYRDALIQLDFSEKANIVLLSHFSNDPELLLEISNNYTYFLIGLMNESEFKLFLAEIILDKEILQKVNYSLIEDLYKKILDKKIELEEESNFEYKINKSSFNNYQQEVLDVSKKYNLNIEESGILDEIISKTIIGVYETSLFGVLLKEKINIDEEKLTELINDVNELIFSKVKENVIKKEDVIDLPLPPYINNTSDEIPLPPAVEEIKKNEVPLPVGKEVISLEKNNSNSFNMISDKLFNKSVSPVTTSDYSLPKMSLNKPISSPANPHDPYREVL